MPNGVKYAPSFLIADLSLTTNPSGIQCFEPDCRYTVLFHPFDVAGGVIWPGFPVLVDVSGVLYSIADKE